MRLPRAIRKWLPTALITAAVAVLGYFATQIAQSVADPFWQHVAPAIPQKLLLSLCCFLLAVVLILIASVVYFYRLSREPTEAEKRKAFDDQFGEFLPKFGVWTHKVMPGYYCQNCKHHYRVSRMLELPNGEAWQCLIQGCEHVA